MASPISFTIELSRCWTTDRVMGSILADILALLFLNSERGRHFGYPARYGVDDRMYIGIRHRGRQCHQTIACRQHATIEQRPAENRLAFGLLLGRIRRTIVAHPAIGEMNFQQRSEPDGAAGHVVAAEGGID